MAKQTGFTIEVSSRYEGWWRYNVALMCGCFDADDNRIDFTSAEVHIADVGSNLKSKPVGFSNDTVATLNTVACDHLQLYIYIIPHTLPADNDISDTTPFEVEYNISYAGKKLRSGKRLINQWSGASIEVRIDAEAK